MRLLNTEQPQTPWQVREQASRVGIESTSVGRLRQPHRRGALLLDDLLRDAKIVKVLTGHGVLVPEEWHPTGPLEPLAPMPIRTGLVTELYEGVGLPILHMSLHLRVGQGAVRSGLKAAGVDLRAQRTRALHGRTASQWPQGPESEEWPGDQGRRAAEAGGRNRGVIAP